MTKIAEILPQIHYVGVNDRTKHLFEGLWPLPNGVSYNSYLIVDEKVAIVDTVDVCYSDSYIEKIKAVLGDRPIDYLIINHMEPDHSASINQLKLYYPNITLVGNAKTKGMVEGMYGAVESFLVIKDGETLSLGSKTLTFYLTPMVHWPETMMTYCAEEKVLFAGDAFGCFGALNGAVVDTDMDTSIYWGEMYRYYANIVGKYGAPVQRALQKLSGVEINMICSTHGPVWKQEIPKVVGIYDKLSKYEGDKGVVIAYGSMYGTTEKQAEVIASALAEQGVRPIVMHNVTKSHVSYILRDIFKYSGLIIGSPTYNTQLFPEIEGLVSKLEARDMKNRKFGYFGSFVWAGAAVKRLGEFTERVKFEVVGDPVEMKQALSSEVVAGCERLAEEMAKSL